MDNTEIVLYNIEDLQRIFHIGRNKVYQLASTSGFPAMRLNRQILVPKDKLERWIQQNSGKQITL